MVPSRTEILVREQRRRDVLAEVARERLIDAAGHRSPAPAPTESVLARSVARSLCAAAVSRLAFARRWAHVG